MSGLLKFGKNAAVVDKADAKQTLTVTKYPDSEQYELYNGGNTRLTILTELYHEYQESGDSETANRYRFQQVVYTAFTDELDVLIKHMVENEERINMTFIDKVRAIFQIKALYLQKSSEANISNRQLTEYITQLGWSGVRHQAMADMRFAFEKLDSVLSLALNSGMGKPKIQQLRLWLNTIKKYVTWLNEKTAVTFSVEETERLYFKVLNPFDDDIDPINIDAFYQTFIISLSDHLQAFEAQLKPETITFALSTIEQFGAVPDNFSLPNGATPKSPQSAASDNIPREQQQANHHGTRDTPSTETANQSIDNAAEQAPTVPPQDVPGSNKPARQLRATAIALPPQKTARHDYL